MKRNLRNLILGIQNYPMAKQKGDARGEADDLDGIRNSDR